MEVTDRIGQGWLIVLYRQNVIATPFPDALRDVRLRSHGIKGDDAAFQGQRGEQFRNRGLLVRLPGRRPLPQYQSHAGSKGADQMQGVLLRVEN